MKDKKVAELLEQIYCRLSNIDHNVRSINGRMGILENKIKELEELPNTFTATIETGGHDKLSKRFLKKMMGQCRLRGE